MIEFIPNADTKSSIIPRLKTSLRNCKSMKAAIAYWTIAPNYIPELVYALSKKDSFVCIDIQLPTNIDNLDSFKAKNCNVFLHCYELSKMIGKENRISALLHTKTIVFEFEDKTEIWVGSHNFTKRALTGVNFELTSIITTEPKSDYQKQVEDYLALIKNSCIPFNRDNVDFYKRLQGEYDNEDDVDVIEFAGYNLNNLISEQTIQLVSEDESNFGSYNLIGKKIILHGLDLATDLEYIFRAKIINAGSITPDNQKSYEMEFSSRRYAIKWRDTLPYLQKEGVINEALLSMSSYFINIEIHGELENYELFEKPPQSQENWNNIDDSIHLQRMSEEDKKELFGNSKKPIRQGSEKTKELNKIKLKKITLGKDQKFIIDYYEDKQLRLKYESVKNLANEAEVNIPETIKSKQVIKKQILKKVDNGNNGN